MICNLENIDINYEIIGEGKPIVILHGYYIDHTMMVGCMEPVFKDKEGFKRIYIDLPGMGKTKPVESIKTSDDMLEIVIGCIEKIIPNESFMITGLSYGGYLARGVLYKLTDRVNGMLLICPMIVADKEARQLPPHTVLEKDEELLKKIDKAEADDFNSIAVVQNQRTWERYKEEILTGAKLADDKFLTKLSKNGYGFSFDVDDLNIKYDIPTLFILGKQDSTVGYKDAWNILDKYSRASFAVLDKAGHNIQIEQEQVFNSLVREWLSRIK
jgi:pimeloyl-ACP methyl ester carboxylesterase